MLMEEASGLGQAQGPATLQQGHAQLLFELLDLPAQRGLGDVQAFRGTGEIEGFGKRLEVAQVAKLHGGSRAVAIMAGRYLAGIELDKLYIGPGRSSRPLSGPDENEPDGY
ncbi:hypothetical protein D3C85_1515370 [compost metagenome]